MDLINDLCPTWKFQEKSESERRTRTLNHKDAFKPACVTALQG